MSTAAAELALSIDQVSKVYVGGLRRRHVHALRNVAMRVPRASVFGLLGPNGAGKSTLVKILMTVIRPTMCNGLLLGSAIGDKSVLKHVGYLPEHHRFPDYLTGAQVLDFYGAMAQVPRRIRRARSAELLDLMGIAAWSNQRVRQYSKGMRQRLGVAQALINDPDLVVLDEPTDGVDPVGRRDIRTVLLHLKGKGKTIFINSHLLSELEMVCDEVAILVQGSVSATGSIASLTRGQERLLLEVDSPPMPLTEFISGASERRTTTPAGNTTTTFEGRLPTGEVCELSTDRFSVHSGDPACAQGLIDALRARGVTIRSFRVQRPSLEDLFMSAVTDPVTGETKKPGAAA